MNLGPSRVPVWAWRLFMRSISRRENARFNADPLTDVEYAFDLDYVGDGIRGHRLDVIVPRQPHPGSGADAPLPVYVYFHGGGWTSGDKAPLTKYCASQAAGGMVVVNANYRHATTHTMDALLQDADAVLDWVGRHIEGYGGDPERIVLGGDSAGGQIAALYTAAVHDDALAEHHGLAPRMRPHRLKGLVQHCSVNDFSVLFERGFVLGLGFVRMLLPRRAPGGRRGLAEAARMLSPIEWLGAAFPPVFVTTSERDYLYRSNLNFIARLRELGVRVDALIYDRHRPNTLHTWQQDAHLPESQEVYRRLRAFVSSVAGSRVAAAAR